MKEQLDKIFTVKTIMTPREKLATWPSDRDPSALWARDDVKRFDLVPAASDGDIIGVWQKDAAEPEPLAHGWLVSQDTPIADLIRLFVDTGKPGFLVIYGQALVGIVTPADLNKLPTRAYLYNLIGDLEMTLGKWIAGAFKDDTEGLLDLLGSRSRSHVESKIEKTEKGNVDTDPIQLLYLSDLITIVSKQPALRETLGFPSRSAAESDLNGLNSLRSDIMHPVRPLLEETPADLQQLDDRMQRIRAVLNKLKSPLEAEAAGAPG